MSTDNNIETLPAVIFESILLDENEPVKLTPELIREKSAPLLELSIKDIFDEAGLKLVKAAKQKIIKTRTTIEKMETAKNSELKKDYNKAKKEVTDYTATLYAACKEGENALQLKISTHENEKAAASLKMAQDKLAKTQGRDQKMYDLGMKFNGQAFMEYGKYVSQDVLHEMTDEKFEALLVELDGLRMEQGVTGNKIASAEPVSKPASSGIGWTKTENGTHTIGEIADTEQTETYRVYETAIYERRLASGMRLIITRGEVENPDGNADVINDRILESAYYIQVAK